jgi:hypothetical protein
VFSTYSINWLGLTTETGSVYCAVRAESKSIKQFNFFSLNFYCKVLFECEYGCDTIITDDNYDNTNYNVSKKNDITSFRPVSYRRLEGLGVVLLNIGNYLAADTV